MCSPAASGRQNQADFHGGRAISQLTAGGCCIAGSRWGVQSGSFLPADTSWPSATAASNAKTRLGARSLALKRI